MAVVTEAERQAEKQAIDQTDLINAVLFIAHKSQAQRAIMWASQNGFISGAMWGLTLAAVICMMAKARKNG